MQLQSYQEFAARYSGPQSPPYKFETKERNERGEITHSNGLVFKSGAWTSCMHAATLPAWGMPASEGIIGADGIGLDGHIYVHPGQVFQAGGMEALLYYRILWAREHLREANRCQEHLYPLRAGASLNTADGSINTTKCDWDSWLHILGDPPVNMPDPLEVAMTPDQEIGLAKAWWQLVLDKVAEHQASYETLKSRYNDLPSVVKRRQEAERHNRANAEIRHVDHGKHKAVRELGLVPVNLD